METMSKLTHFDKDGRAAMVDVSAKVPSVRSARASGRVIVSDEAFALAQSGANKKGDPGPVAELAGIMAAKKTADLIPLCHKLALSKVKVTVRPDAALPGFQVEAFVTTTGQTGVEMEALTAVSAACLTVYDMLKAADRSIMIEAITLEEKTGGMRGDYKRGDTA